MEAGDACITMYRIPHSATRNENGTDARQNIIFRIATRSANPLVVPDNCGVTDHPDCAFNDGWLKFEPGNDPWERSKQSMIDMLADDQQDVSDVFAQTGKAADIAWARRRTGAPILAGVMAYVECSLAAEHDAGDHTVGVGQVHGFETLREDAKPLVYFAAAMAFLDSSEAVASLALVT